MSKETTMSKARRLVGFAMFSLLIGFLLVILLGLTAAGVFGNPFTGGGLQMVAPIALQASLLDFIEAISNVLDVLALAALIILVAFGIFELLA